MATSDISFKSLLGASSTLFISEMLAQGAAFARNLIIARILEPSDFGVASTIAIVVTFLELISGVDIGRYITRSNDPEMEKLVSFSHTAAVCRGVVSAGLLALLGPLIASFLKMNDYAWAFSMIAVVPLIKGFVNLGIWRQQRDLKFKSYALFQVIPQILVLLFSYPVALYFQDYRAMLLLVVLNAALAVLVSHIVGGNRIAFSFDKTRMKELIQYAGPLWFDGVFVFLVMNGERLIVAREFGQHMVGLYSALILLVITPMGIVSRVAQSIGVPVFLRKMSDQQELNKVYRFTAHIYGVLSLPFTFFFGISATAVLPFIFGDNYQLASSVILLVGIMFAFKMLRGASTVLILVSGKTWVTAIANGVRLAGVFVCWLVSVETQSIDSMFVAAVVAEIVALLIAVFGVKSISRSGIPVTIVYLFLNLAIFWLFLEFSDHLENLNLSNLLNVLVSIGATLLLMASVSMVAFNKPIRSIMSGKNS